MNRRLPRTLGSCSEKSIDKSIVIPKGLCKPIETRNWHVVLVPNIKYLLLLFKRTSYKVEIFQFCNRFELALTNTIEQDVKGSI